MNGLLGRLATMGGPHALHRRCRARTALALAALRLQVQSDLAPPDERFPRAGR